jgi:hypothetical protein
VKRKIRPLVFLIEWLANTCGVLGLNSEAFFFSLRVHNRHRNFKRKIMRMHKCIRTKVLDKRLWQRMS